MKTAEEIVKALADWSRKWPKEKVHSMSSRVPMDNELYAIEDFIRLDKSCIDTKVFYKEARKELRKIKLNNII